MSNQFLGKNRFFQAGETAKILEVPPTTLNQSLAVHTHYLGLPYNRKHYSADYIIHLAAHKDKYHGRTNKNLKGITTEFAETVTAQTLIITNESDLENAVKTNLMQLSSGSENEQIKVMRQIKVATLLGIGRSTLAGWADKDLFDTISATDDESGQEVHLLTEESFRGLYSWHRPEYNNGDIVTINPVTTFDQNEWLNRF